MVKNKTKILRFRKRGVSKIVMSIFIGAVLIVTAAFGFIVQSKNSKAATQSAKMVALRKETEDAQAIKNHQRIEYDIYNDMHNMINSVVIADDVRTKEEITEAKIASLTKEVTVSQFSDKDDVLAILNKWAAGDFTQADKDHNYVWGNLQGTVGVATGVDVAAIPKWAKVVAKAKKENSQ
ncbi:DUF6241 domain-containing protein [Clostridium algoriphilum]|uniref:DUF6241 domain-containing protein n=1 Tax=Clostridium algoriphilum TaxID=198347 RepID=UPI001CF1183B|nr:DUF6241 domain-containing protein [Clostridium algoriphilum]MCB2292370.1 DUF6241 domain-containing protein [Clostridium algoriphilum]